MTDTDVGANDDDGIAVLHAALIYDRPALGRLSRPDARAFIQIFDLRGPLDDGLDATPLGAAALALHDIWSGERATGIERLSQLATADGDEEQAQLTRLLGLTLRAWIENTPDGVDRAAASAHAVDNDLVAALVLAKLAGFSLDAGRREVATALAAAALERVPNDRGRLAWRLRQSAATIGGGWRVEQPPAQVDPLAEFPWIHAHGARAAHDAIVRAAVSKVENPWSPTVRYGETPLDGTTAAILQAEWAGAIWLVPELQLQHAALIIGQNSHPTQRYEDAAYGWIAAGGQRLSDTLDALEPHFDNGSVRRLLLDRLHRGARLRTQDRYVDVVAALWDLLDEELAHDVLRTYRPAAGHGPGQDRLNGLWMRLAVLVPERWADEFQQLRNEERAALLPFLEAWVVERLPDPAVDLLVETCEQAITAPEDQPATNDPYEAAAILLATARVTDERCIRLRQLLGAAPVEEQLPLLLKSPMLQDVFDVPQLLEMALTRLQTEAERSRRGTYAHFARPPVAMARAAAIAFPEEPLSHIIADEIVRLSLDAALMSEFRTDVLNAQWRLVLHEVFAPRVVQRADEHAEFRDGFFSAPGEANFQKALLECTRFVATPTTDAVQRVLTHSRDTDPRVRRIAIHAAAHTIEQHLLGEGTTAELLLWGAVVASLFDPVPSVIELGLSFIQQYGAIASEYATVVADRLVRLSDEGGRDLRRLVVGAAAQLTANDQAHRSALEPLVAHGASDRSWLVREAAGRG